MPAPSSQPTDHSRTEKTEIVLPQHANAGGTAFGGTILAWIDICAAVCAQRHCGRVAVTASIDEVQFLAPIRVGDVVQIEGRINAAFHTSVEIEVRVEREDPSKNRTLCANAYLSFVSLDPSTKKPCPVPALELKSQEEKNRFDQAKKRREHRLIARKHALSSSG